MTLLSAADVRMMHRDLVQLSNADLTQIATPGPLATNGDPGTPVAVWTGTAPGFLQRQAADILSSEVEVSTPKDTFRLFDAAGAPPVLLAAGPDWSGVTVVVADRRLSPVVTRRFAVIGLEREQDGTLDGVLLTLNAETV